MADPIASTSFSPALSSTFDDDPSLSCRVEPEASAAAAASQVCAPPEVPGESAVSSSAAALVQKFPHSDQSAFFAESRSPPASASAPGLLTVRPDQLDVQTGIPRIQGHTTLGSVQLSAGVDILNASAHLGSLNADGSRGENIGAGANLLGGELSIDYKGWSLTVGVAASLGGSISSGEGRDSDGDGVQERCFAMSLGPFTLGECDEL